MQGKSLHEPMQHHKALHVAISSLMSLQFMNCPRVEFVILYTTKMQRFITHSNYLLSFFKFVLFTYFIRRALIALQQQL